MLAILTLLTVLTLSLLVVRVATVALVLTGISRPLARFQARSAFTGCGFTTGESEKIVTHPVRRRIVMTLMLLGNAGIVTTVATLLAGFVGPTSSTFGLGFGWRIGILLAGLAALWFVSYSQIIDRWISRITHRLLRKYTKLDVRDYANLLHLSGEYGVSEIMINAGDWIADRTLADLRLSQEGIIVLAIQRPAGEFVGAPRGTAVPRAGDTLLIYGRTSNLRELDTRRRDFVGEVAHAQAIQDAAAEAEEQAGEQAEHDAAEEAQEDAEEQERTRS
ncbi:MAG: TrkA C-terminal domain-containing protein [Phycisphaerae bacterium]